jgi:aldehyde dehydrogenase (NAD+)
MQDEIFGPILPIIEVDSLQESIDLINSHDKPLAAYGFFDDKADTNKFISEVSSGGMTINDTIVHLSNKDLPFGGIGESGMGHYMGKYSFSTFSHEKAVMRRGFALEHPMRYPPYKRKLFITRKLMQWFG